MKDAFYRIESAIQHQINEANKHWKGVVGKRESCSESEEAICRYLNGLKSAYYNHLFTNTVISSGYYHASPKTNFDKMEAMMDCMHSYLSIVDETASIVDQCDSRFFLGQRIATWCVMDLVMAEWNEALVEHTKAIISALAATRRELFSDLKNVYSTST